ncbi:hypothetical protein PilKf_01144 [Pillotina sp. SPG140]|jgi:uncharacterized protein (TIGR00251 family)
MNGCIRKTNDALLLDIKLIPNAACVQFVAIQQCRLKITVTAPPEHGKANSALITVLSKACGCPKKDILIRSGATTRLKTLSIPLKYEQQLESLLDNLPQY